MNIAGNIEGRTIAPMLLIPFVENAFKHGSKNGPMPGIIINLAVADNRFEFGVINHLRRNTAVTRDQVGGIGLTNIRRRLNLLYPGKHQLDITSDDTSYHIKLILWV